MHVPPVPEPGNVTPEILDSKYSPPMAASPVNSDDGDDNYYGSGGGGGGGGPQTFTSQRAMAEFVLQQARENSEDGRIPGRLVRMHRRRSPPPPASARKSPPTAPFTFLWMDPKDMAAMGRGQGGRMMFRPQPQQQQQQQQQRMGMGMGMGNGSPPRQQGGVPPSVLRMHLERETGAFGRGRGY